MKITPEIKKLLSVRADKNNTVVITCCNSAYLTLLVNWLFNIDNLKISNYVIFAMDNETYQFCQKKKIPAIEYLSSYSDKNLNFWQSRVEIFSMIIQAGFSFIHSDTDAIWKKNPLSLSYFEGKYDIVSSMGFAFPYEVVKKWGFILCCGFFFLKCSKFIKLRLLPKWKDLIMKKKPDDQASLNFALLSFKPKWNETPHLHFSKQPLTGSGFFSTGKNNKMYSIIMLPHGLFQRQIFQNKKVMAIYNQYQPYVVHPRIPATTGKAKSKYAMFRRAGIFNIKEKWYKYDKEEYTWKDLKKVISL